MLEDDETEELMEKFGISEEGRTILRKIRSNEPERRVASSRVAGNVSGTFPSRKMGRTIQFESHSVELRAILVKYEYDSDCLEYWDQPSRSGVWSTKASTERGSGPSTPPTFSS